MNSFNIAFKMFKNNLKSYGFYLSVMVFAVAVYYNFMVLKYEPAFLKAQDAIQVASIAASVTSFILVVFLIFFISYSSSFFMKQRKKEIAMYSLMGISNAKIGAIFSIESIFTGITSIAAGLSLGILFSRLFMMAITKVTLLDVAITFTIPEKGIIELCIVFGVIFLAVSLDIFIHIARSKLIDLIRESSKEEKKPKFMLIRAILAILLIGAGYYFSKYLTLALPVVFVVSLGTFWLFGALLPTITKALIKNKAVLYKGVRIISINNITFRIKSNYKALAMLAVMTATTITAFGTSLSLRYYVDETHHIEFPYSFSYVSDDKTLHEKIAENISKSKHKLILDKKIEFIKTKIKIDTGYGNGFNNIAVVKSSDFLKVYESLRTHYGDKAPEIKSVADNNAQIILSAATLGNFITFEGREGQINDQKFNVISDFKAPFFGTGEPLGNTECMIISDEAYEKLAKTYKPQTFNGFIVSDPKNSLELSLQIKKLMPHDIKLTDYATKYKSTYTYMGLFYFLGSFMSIVFIFATGSIMYFKILSEALADKNKYDILKKIGMSKNEIKSSVSMQVGLSLLLPLLIGILHSIFAIASLRNQLGISLVVPALIAVAIYILCYGFFFLATTKKFMKIVYTD